MPFQAQKSLVKPPIRTVEVVPPKKNFKKKHAAGQPPGYCLPNTSVGEVVASGSG